MEKWKINNMNIGDKLPELHLKPITRETLSLYASASGDHNPIHTDIGFAKKSGLNDVIAHGMLIMGYLGIALTDYINQENIKEYGVIFSSITNIGDLLRCNGVITEIKKIDNHKHFRIELEVLDQNNDNKLTGYSIIEF